MRLHLVGEGERQAHKLVWSIAFTENAKLIVLCALCVLCEALRSPRGSFFKLLRRKVAGVAKKEIT
jgi:hypothetical protein